MHAVLRMVSDGGSAYHASNPGMLGGAMEGTVPILHVAEARASIEWYARLGFEVEWQHTFEPGWPLYVSLRRGPGRLHLSEHRLDGGPATHVYLYVEDVDSVVPPGTVPEDCPWGMREARLIDPDGNEIRIGSPLRERESVTQRLQARRPASDAVRASLEQQSHPS